MRWFSNIWRIALIVVLLLSANQGFASPSSSCPNAACVYLPLVSLAPPVRVNDSIAQGTYWGTYRVLGDVANTTNFPVYDVVLTVRLYDTIHQLIGTKMVTTVLTATLPEQLNPFSIDTGFDASTSSHDVTVSGWTTSSPQTYLPATIVLTQTAQVPFGRVVTTTLRNDEAVPLLDVQGVTWAFSDANPFFRQSITPSLAPGAIVTFSTFLYEPSVFAPVNVAAQGVITP